MHCCPYRVCTAHAAGGVIRDCLAAARNCWYVVTFADRNCRYAICYRRLAADHNCRYAVCYRRLAAGRIICDHLAAASHCRYAVAFPDRNCRYAICYRRLDADHRCRYALSAVVFPSIATVEDTAAAGPRRKSFAAHPSRN